MPDVTVPTAPPLAGIAGVELVQTGQWDISTGRITVTTDDLASAIGAVDCPAVRRPVIVMGHRDPRFSGEPAVGWIDNMLLAKSGNTLVGDYVGMPGWLVVPDENGNRVINSAYPDRSFEGYFDWKCQLGHTHPFVITAMALLGATEPGIGTLQSLQDVGTLFGVAAASETPDRGEQVTITIRASKEPVMPNPRPMQVAAAVSSEDVRRAYYENAGWSIWICEMQLDPLQLITVDDDSGQYARVPIVLDGDDVTFGESVRVRIEYVDMPADSSTPAAAAAGRLVFASRAESRPGLPPGNTAAANATGQPEPVLTADQLRQAAASQNPPAAPAAEDTQEGAAMDAAKLREALGLSPEATDEEVTAALATNGLGQPAATEGGGDAPEGEAAPEGEEAPVEPVSASQTPPDTVVVDATTFAELRAAAEDGRAARVQQLTEARDTAISAAITEGKIPPARKEHWEASWKADPDGTKATLASLAPGLVPVADNGVPGGDAPSTENGTYDAMFSRPAKEA